MADETSLVMKIDSPFGEDLLFHGMQAREEVSRLSEFEVNLLSLKPDLATADILGQNVTVEVALNESRRSFNGYVTRFAQGGTHGRYYRYHARLSPWLWYLTRTADCRIFQDKPVPDILKDVFEDIGMASVSFELTATYPKRTYCVQYRETDFNFVSRLMEQEGIYYFFRHESGKHTMVITDSYAKHEKTPGYETLNFVMPGTTMQPAFEHVYAWDFAREVQSGLYVHDDYDAERPSVELLVQRPTPTDYAEPKLEVYDYPGNYLQRADGTHYSQVRALEMYGRVERARAYSNALGVQTGALFSLADFPRDDQNVEHLILSTTYEFESVNYEADGGDGESSGCRCAFTAMPTSVPFRPRRVTPRPFVQGPQTAVVVGPAGEEIFTDKFGRVKTQFHWDRRGKKDENSSCWIRVSHPWAGKNWGAVALPRIGQEVVVDFLEGDPDQPIITGRVYNAEQMPPYDLPANKTQSGVKSRSSLGGGAANFNEIRFEDKKGSEQLFIHAEKNQDIEVENDETHWVGHDRTKTIDHDETTHVKHDRTETVDNNETILIGGNRTETVVKDETITIQGNRTISVSKNETATVTMQRTHTVGINESITIGAGQQVTVGGVQAITVGANQSTSVGGTQANSVGGSRTVKTGGSQATTIAKNLTVNVGKNEEYKVGEARTVNIGKDDQLTVGKKLLIKAADAIEIKTGDASIMMKKDGTIVIKGKDITVQGSGKINVKASSDIVMKGSKIKQN